MAYNERKILEKKLSPFTTIFRQTVIGSIEII